MIKKFSTLPPKNRPEWEDLVKGKINHRFTNFTLQMKSADYSKKLSKGEITPQQAIDEIYSLCSKYILAVQQDMKAIFKEW